MVYRCFVRRLRELPRRAKIKGLVLIMAPGLMLALLGCGSLEYLTAALEPFHGAWHAYATDMDGDGDVDVLGASFFGNLIAWWENDGSQRFTLHPIAGDYGKPSWVYATDLDADGDSDVLAAGFHECAISWWRNDPSGEPPPADPIDWTRYDFSHALCEAVSVHAVDINADQDVHVIGTVQDDHNVVILWEKRANESLPWLERTISSDLEWPAVVHAADVDGDGDTDIVGAAEGSDAVVWWENLGDADPRFLQHTIRENLDGAFSVYATDINGDANVDLLCAAYGDDSVVWWENTGSKPVTFAEHNITSSFEGARIVYATDVDGVGDVDILGAAMDADSIAWWENSGGPSPSFAEHIIDGGFDGASCVHAADLDGDGDTDVVGTAALADEIAWWEHKPSGDSLPLDPVNWTKHTIKN